MRQERKDNIPMNDKGFMFYSHDGHAELKEKHMSREDFTRIPVAVKIANNVFRVEELYHMLILALVEFNDLTSREADLSRYSTREEFDFGIFRIDCNRRAANFLTVLKMYQEYVAPGEKGERSLFGVGTQIFQKEAFKTCNVLRNYIQHVASFPVTITWSSFMLACNEELKSVHVAIPVEELLKNTSNIKAATLQELQDIANGLSVIDVTEAFLSAMDFIDAIHCTIRAGEYCSNQYQRERDFLLRIDNEYPKSGLWCWRDATKDSSHCDGTVPYLAQKQIHMIDYFRRKYKCDGCHAKCFITSMPTDLVKRLAEADKDVAGFVNKGGMVVESPSTGHKIFSSRFNSKERLDWYANYKPFGT